MADRYNVLDGHDYLAPPDSYSLLGFSLDKEHREFLVKTLYANCVMALFPYALGESHNFFFSCNRHHFVPDGLDLSLFAGGFTDGSTAPEHKANKFEADDLSGTYLVPEETKLVKFHEKAVLADKRKAIYGNIADARHFVALHSTWVDSDGEFHHKATIKSSVDKSGAVTLETALNQKRLEKPTLELGEKEMRCAAQDKGIQIAAHANLMRQNTPDYATGIQNSKRVRELYYDVNVREQAYLYLKRDGNDKAIQTQSMALGIHSAYIGIPQKNDFMPYIVLDIDNANYGLIQILGHFGIKPNLITINPTNPHSLQMMFLFEQSEDMARKADGKIHLNKMGVSFKFLIPYLNFLFQGDPNFNHSTFKNPVSHRWSAHTIQVRQSCWNPRELLEAIFKFVKLKEFPYKKEFKALQSNLAQNKESTEHKKEALPDFENLKQWAWSQAENEPVAFNGRNCMLFTAWRNAAYHLFWKRDFSVDEVKSFLRQWATEKDCRQIILQNPEQFPQSEINDIIKSICRFLSRNQKYFNGFYKDADGKTVTIWDERNKKSTAKKEKRLDFLRDQNWVMAKITRKELFSADEKIRLQGELGDFLGESVTMRTVCRDLGRLADRKRVYKEPNMDRESINRLSKSRFFAQKIVWSFLKNHETIKTWELVNTGRFDVALFDNPNIPNTDKMLDLLLFKPVGWLSKENFMCRLWDKWITENFIITEGETREADCPYHLFYQTFDLPCPDEFSEEQREIPLLVPRNNFLMYQGLYRNSLFCTEILNGFMKSQNKAEQIKVVVKEYGKQDRKYTLKTASRRLHKHFLPHIGKNHRGNRSRLPAHSAMNALVKVRNENLAELKAMFKPEYRHELEKALRYWLPIHLLQTFIDHSDGYDSAFREIPIISRREYLDDESYIIARYPNPELMNESYYRRWRERALQALDKLRRDRKEAMEKWHDTRSERAFELWDLEVLEFRRDFKFLERIEHKHLDNMLLHQFCRQSSVSARYQKLFRVLVQVLPVKKTLVSLSKINYTNIKTKQKQTVLQKLGQSFDAQAFADDFIRTLGRLHPIGADKEYDGRRYQTKFPHWKFRCRHGTPAVLRI